MNPAHAWLVDIMLFSCILALYLIQRALNRDVQDDANAAHQREPPPTDHYRRTQASLDAEGDLGARSLGESHHTPTRDRG